MLCFPSPLKTGFGSLWSTVVNRYLSVFGIRGCLECPGCAGCAFLPLLILFFGVPHVVELLGVAFFEDLLFAEVRLHRISRVSLYDSIVQRYIVQNLKWPSEFCVRFPIAVRGFQLHLVPLLVYGVRSILGARCRESKTLHSFWLCINGCLVRCHMHNLFHDGHGVSECTRSAFGRSGFNCKNSSCSPAHTTLFSCLSKGFSPLRDAMNGRLHCGLRRMENDANQDFQRQLSQNKPTRGWHSCAWKRPLRSAEDGHGYEAWKSLRAKTVRNARGLLNKLLDLKFSITDPSTNGKHRTRVPASTRRELVSS